jgi:nucleoside-diphosphate-sugar epimerase
MNVMVTGGSGFIGSFLTRQLLEEGHQVTVFDVMPDIQMLHDVLDEVQIIRGDLRNLEEVLTVAKNNHIEDVFHLGSLLLDACAARPLEAERVNVGGTLNILEMARILESIKRVVFADSISVFSSNQTEPVREDSPKDPATVYGATKLFGEWYGLYYARTYSVDFRAIRLSNAYGPGGRGRAAWRCDLIERPLLGEPVKIPFRDAKLDWLYVKDAARAFILARDARSPRKRVYDIAGSMHCISEVVDIVRKFVPDAKIEFGQEELQYASFSMDDALAREEIGWKPSFTLEKGIADFADCVKRRGNHSSSV